MNRAAAPRDNHHQHSQCERWIDCHDPRLAITDNLYQRLAKRGIDIRALEVADQMSAGGGKRKQLLTVKRGAGQKLGKEIQKLIKDSGLKVQTQIQGEQLRVTGKKRDDLQKVHCAVAV